VSFHPSVAQLTGSNVAPSGPRRSDSLREILTYTVARLRLATAVGNLELGSNVALEGSGPASDEFDASSKFADDKNRQPHFSTCVFGEPGLHALICLIALAKLRDDVGIDEVPTHRSMARGT